MTFKDLEKALEVLKGGGIVMHPTETCYGFAVDIFDERALRKLYELKGRDASKSISILVSDLKMAQEYGKFSNLAIELAEKYWPGPLTIVVPRKKKLPQFFNEGDNFVGIRCSSEGFSLKLVKQLGNPVTTTSANPSGILPSYVPDVKVFGDNASLIDYVVDSGEISNNKPSTVVKVVENKIEILREGDLKVL